METKRFKTFDKVLIRDGSDKWQIDFYAYWDKDYKIHHTMSYGGGLDIRDDDILPYEGNEHLVGRVDEPDEEVRLEEEEWVMASDFEKIEEGYSSITKFSHIDRRNNKFICQDKGIRLDYEYAIRFKDFNPEDMEETKKHILCVRNGRIVIVNHDRRSN